MFTTRQIVIAIVALTAILLLYPFETTLVPEQRARVITDGSNPVQHAWVRQTWFNYSYERTWHEADLQTDANGRVAFPPRTVRASLLLRSLGLLRSITTRGGVRMDIFPLPRGGNVSPAVVQPHPDETVFRVAV